MRKLTDYVEMAATEYLQETGKDELDSLWIAEFFQDCGVQDDYPKQDLVDFFALVQSVTCDGAWIEGEVSVGRKLTAKARTLDSVGAIALSGVQSKLCDA